MNDLLATAVLHALSLQHRFAYAQVNSDGVVVSCSANLAELLNIVASDIVGQVVTAVFPELIGAETSMLAIHQQRLPFYRLENVNYIQHDGTVLYLTVQLTAISKQGLLLLVEDKTEEGKIRQALEQAENELHLLRQQLNG